MTSQVPSRENSNAPIDSNALVSSISGGLNTVSGDLNLPRGDSPLMYNVDVTESGHIKTRDGSQSVFVWSGGDEFNLEGTVLIPYVTKAGRTIVFQKVDNSMYVHAFLSEREKYIGTSEFVTSFNNVWPTYMNGIQPDYVVTNEITPRIIFTSGICNPIQFTLVEATVTVTSGTTFNTFDIESTLLEFASNDDVVIWTDGDDPRIANSVSYSGGTLTVTVPSKAAGTYTFDFVYISWQWLCQGIQLTGSDVYQSVTRFHATETDKTIPIPIDMLRNLEEIGNTNRFPIIPYKTSTRGDYYTIDSDASPADWDEFSFSSGSIVYSESRNSDRIVPGISHITFGDLRDTDAGSDPDNPEEVHLIRAIRLDFDDDAASFTNSDVIVLINGVEATEINASNLGSNTTDWGESYTLRSNVTDTTLWSSSSVSSNGGTCKYVTFDGSVDVGISSSAVIEILLVDVNSYLGSGAVASYSSVPRIGYATPWHGIQEHASYAKGSFPRTVEIVGGRLAIGGFPQDPLRVVLSDIKGINPNARDYSNFSIARENLESTDPVLVAIDTNEADSRISAMGVAAGNLIVFTTKSCFRVYGGSNALTPTSVIVSLVARTGCVNSRSVVGIENTLVFLSLGGVFRLAPSIEIGDFAVRLLSDRINTEVKNRNNITAGYVAYDPSNNRLFVGVTDNINSVISNKMYVYSFVRQAWTEYRTVNGYWMSASAAFMEIESPFMLFAMGWDAVTPSSKTNELISYPYEYPSDFTHIASWASITGFGYHEMPSLYESQSLTDNEILDAYELTTFRMSPFSNHEDVKVQLDGVDLTYLTQVIKTNESQLTVNRVTSSGSTLTLYPINDEGRYPVSLFVDNVYVEDDELTFTYDTTTVEVNFVESPTSSQIVRFGYSIPYMYTTPIQVRNNLQARKRTDDMYVMLRNIDYQTRFVESEVNSAASQTVSQIVGNWKVQVNCNIYKVVDFSEIQNSIRQNDAVGPNTLFWDLGAFDSDANHRQSDRYTRVGVAMKGSSNTMQIFIHAYDYKVFELIAYQLIATNLSRSTF